MIATSSPRSIEMLSVFLEQREGKRQHVGRLGFKDRQIIFEYDSNFLSTLIQLSPFKVPLRSGVFQGDPHVFDGLMGVFEDSLPDGWGRLLLDRRIAALGLGFKVTPLDRLAWVGHRSMGALVYEPERELEESAVVDLKQIADDSLSVLENVKAPDLDRLIALGGSPQGARPKALVQIDNQSQRKIVFGAGKILKGYTPFIVKFQAKGDHLYTGSLEHAYAKMAAACGIRIPETRMLGKSKRHPGYFAIRRFDRQEDDRGVKKIHMHSLSGLLHAPHTYPSLTYSELLLVTQKLTRSDAEVAEMFRRACFNVFARNRDDHPKNFAFLMDEVGEWRASPAYDLTFSNGMGGEHMLLVGGEGRNPTRKNLERLASETGVKDSSAIIEEVRLGVSRFREFADEAGLPKKDRNRIAEILEKKA